MLIRSQITLLKIFCEFLLYFQTILKSMRIAEITIYSNSECERVNTCIHSSLDSTATLQLEYIGIMK